MTSDDRSERRAIAQAKRVRARLDQELQASFPDTAVRQQILDVIAPAVDDELRYKDHEIERVKGEAAKAKAALHWLRSRVRSIFYARRYGKAIPSGWPTSVEEALDDPQSMAVREIHFYTCVISYPDNQVEDVNWGSHPENDFNEIDYSTPEVARRGGEGRIVIVSCFDLDLCREAFETARDEAQQQLAAVRPERP